MSVLIWSKPNCANCERSKKLLESRKIQYQERVIGQGWTKENLLEQVPAARSVPQIMINNRLIGGYQELINYFEQAGDHI